MAKGDFSERDLRDLSDRLNSLSKRLMALATAMRVLKVEQLGIDKTAYMFKAITTVDDFVSNGFRSLRKEKPTINVHDFVPPGD
ncbi:MAG: hypothetical protein K1X71_02260 [Pirellulales bacterium]|nr:hypothetical protein [Pirellulales bacterium]